MRLDGPLSHFGHGSEEKIPFLVGNLNMVFHNQLVTELPGCHGINMKTGSYVSCLTVKEDAANAKKMLESHQNMALFPK
jgi:hypothetical protein